MYNTVAFNKRNLLLWFLLWMVMAATILPCAEETCLTGAPLFVVAVANAVATLYVLQGAAT